MEPKEASMNRTILVVLVTVALISVAADGSAPWRNQFPYGREIMTQEEFG